MRNILIFVVLSFCSLPLQAAESVNFSGIIKQLNEEKAEPIEHGPTVNWTFKFVDLKEKKDCGPTLKELVKEAEDALNGARSSIDFKESSLIYKGIVNSYLDFEYPKRICGDEFTKIMKNFKIKLDIVEFPEY